MTGALTWAFKHSREESKRWTVPTLGAVRWWYIVIGVFAVLLIAARLYLPVWLERYVIRTLNRIPGYHAALDTIHVHLWRGAYSIDGLKLEKTGGKVPVPFF